MIFFLTGRECVLNLIEKIDIVNDYFGYLGPWAFLFSHRLRITHGSGSFILPEQCLEESSVQVSVSKVLIDVSFLAGTPG